jgi:thiamine kinase-like enzyme
MSGIEGEPLYNFVTNLHYSLDNLFCYTMKCIEWLKKIHCANIPRKAFIDNASDKFKKYKIDLQYNRLLNYLNETSRQNATLFIDSYINSKEQLVHGDFNSRNILLNTNTNQIGIIDFEQAHIGSGVYDVAYIASELIIRIVASQNEDKKLDEYIEKIFNSYYDDRLNLKTTFVIFSKHLFFQVLYRLVGPSKLAWSGHLNEVKKTEIIHFSITRLNELFIV